MRRERTKSGPRPPPAVPAPSSPAPTSDAGRVIGWPRSLSPTKEHQVAELIRERIISGQLARGLKLKQDEIAKALGVSITPVREALRILDAQGYVAGYSHRGVVVAPLEVEKSQELFELRLQLEVPLVRIAASRITTEDLPLLDELNREYVSAAATDAKERMRRANYQFHFRLYALAGRTQTLEFVRVLWAKYPWDLVSLIPDRFKRADVEHKSLIAALHARDAASAARAMRAHIENNWREFTTAYPLYRTTAAGQPAGAPRLRQRK